MNIIPYGRQHLTDDDIQAVVETMKSDYLTQGPKVKEFEDRFAEYIGVKYAIAVANGTAALHLCSLALKVKPGQKVITTPITFAASANCICYCGGEVVFVDIDPKTYLIDLVKLEKLLWKNPEGTFAGIIPVDFAGYPVDLEKLYSLTQKYNLWIIDDACHAPGGFFKDKKGINQQCGNGNFADLTIFSFHPVKHITTGEGGMITTNNKNLYEKLLLYRTHGITKNPSQMHENHGGWYYEMLELGYNYRLSDIHAALGVSQLKRADDMLKKRIVIAKKYNQAFKDLPITLPFVSDNIHHAYHLYILKTKKRNELYNYLKEHGIFVQVHYIPVHLHPYYKNMGWKKGDFPVAEKFYEECISLPMYPTLSDKDQNFVIETILNYYN